MGSGGLCNWGQLRTGKTILCDCYHHGAINQRHRWPQNAVHTPHTGGNFTLHAVSTYGRDIIPSQRAMCKARITADPASTTGPAQAAREAATPTAACSWSVAPSGLAASFLLLADARSPQLPARLAQLPLELARPRRLGPQ